MAELLLIEQELKRIVKDLENRINPVLLNAIEYSLFPGGKRVRPILCIAAFKSVNGVGNRILSCACALELIHTSSLIKDDLPAMDNHKERRGNPTCWSVFGEATAMLAADILSTEAYRILTLQPNMPLLVEVLNTVISMTNGQELDCRGIKSQEVNGLKTASLFEACYVIGGIIGGATEEKITSLRQKGYAYGIEFQRQDDIADGEVK